MWSWRLAPTVRRAAALMTDCRRSRSTGVAKGGTQKWVHKKIPGCAVEIWQPNILNNCYGLSGGYAPPNHPPGALPLWGTSVPRPPVPPPPNPGYATVQVAAWQAGDSDVAAVQF